MAAAILGAGRLNWVDPVAAIAEGDMLPIIFFSLLLAVFINATGGESGQTLRRFFRVLVEDVIAVARTDLAEIAPGRPITAVLHHADGSEESFALEHSLNEEQVEWFKAGSALNVLRNK